MFFNLSEVERIMLLEGKYEESLVLIGAALAGKVFLCPPSIYVVFADENEQVESVPERVLPVFQEFMENELNETSRRANAYAGREILAMFGDYGQAMFNRMCRMLWEDNRFVPSTNRKRG